MAVPVATGWVTDACVPIFRLAECIPPTKAEPDEVPSSAPLVGDVADSTLFAGMMIEPDNHTERNEWGRFAYRLLQHLLAAGCHCGRRVWASVRFDGSDHVPIWPAHNAQPDKL